MVLEREEDKACRGQGAPVYLSWVELRRCLFADRSFPERVGRVYRECPSNFLGVRACQGLHWWRYVSVRPPSSMRVTVTGTPYTHVVCLSRSQGPSVLSDPSVQGVRVRPPNSFCE